MAQRDPHSSWDADGAKIKHIDFDLHVDFSRKVLRGSANYQFDRPLGKELSLDSRDLQIERVLAPNGGELKWSLGEANFLGQVLTVHGTTGLTELTIRYATSPQSAALQWLDPEQTAGKADPYMFSQCQAILARSVFACQDSPGVRFTYTAKLHVPRGLTAVMAALEHGAQDEGGETVFAFAMPHPIPSYLFALAAGKITAEIIGSRSRVFAEPQTVKGAAWEFADVDRMIEGAESLFGDYIWDEFNLLAMPPSFPYGGMENPTLTFLTPTLIAGDRSLVSVVAHELAHSWTGNLVTNATWEDFWLNEGWTVYAERRIVERLYGTERANLQAASGRTELMKAFETFGGATSPYTKLKTDQKGVDPDEVFSSVPYEKGFLFLTAIERAVGRDVFDKFIHSYIHDFAFKSIVTEDFVNYLDAKLPQARGKVNYDEWIYQPGLPASAPVFSSRLLDDVRAVQKRWQDGDRKLGDALSKWIVDQKTLFLDELPLQQSPEDCALLERLFDIPNTKNSEILLPFFCIAAGSTYRKVFPAIREFLGVVGRGKYLRPLYRAMHQNPETKALARELFAEFKDRYHSVGRNAVARILEKD